MSSPEDPAPDSQTEPTQADRRWWRRRPRTAGTGGRRTRLRPVVVLVAAVLLSGGIGLGIGMALGGDGRGGYGRGGPEGRSLHDHGPDDGPRFGPGPRGAPLTGA